MTGPEQGTDAGPDAAHAAAAAPPRTALGRLRALLSPFVGRIAAGALVLLAAWEIAVLLRARAAAPSERDWRRASAAVRAAWQAGDLVVFAPRWVDPVGRRWLGDLIDVADAARMDATRYGRVWEVTIRGAAAPEVRGEPQPVRDERFGAVRVRLFVRPAPRVVWDLRERSQVHEVAFEPRACVKMNELRDGGATAKLRMQGARLGTELAAYAGLTDFRARKENWGAAIVRVLVDGQEVSRASVGNDDGWRALPLARTTPGAHLVEIEASIDPARGRRPRVLVPCVALEAREPAGVSPAPGAAPARALAPAAGPAPSPPPGGAP